MLSGDIPFKTPREPWMKHVRKRFERLLDRDYHMSQPNESEIYILLLTDVTDKFLNMKTQ